MTITWWTTHSLAKIFPDSQPGHAPSRQIELWAARGEREDAQVAILPASVQEGRIISGVRINGANFSFSALTGPRGAKIPRSCLEGFWQWYVFVHDNPRGNRDRSTVLRTAPGFFPDAFLEDKQTTLRGGMTTPLWVRLSVPADAVPGDYRGSLTIRLPQPNGEVQTIRVPIRLHVWPFTIPARPSLRHTEWCYPNLVADYYHVKHWSEEHWQWLARIARDMVEHRQDTIFTPFSNLVIITRQDNGRLHMDMSRLDRWLDTFLGAGLQWIEGTHVASRVGDWHSQFSWNRFAIRDQRGKVIDTSVKAMTDAQFEPIIRGLIKAVYAHLEKRGLRKRCFQHVADEPLPSNLKSWKRLAGKIHRWIPDVPRIDAVMSEGLEDYCEIRVPQIQEIHGPAKADGKGQMWAYTCLAPQGIYPNRFLDFASIRNRILFWLAWSLHLKGYLHWGYAYWTRWPQVPAEVPLSPWFDAAAASHYCCDSQPLPAGDPHIVYPGKDSICSSLRWEVVRKGMEDYEMLKLLEQAVRRPQKRDRQALAKGRALLEQVRTAIAPSPAGHSHDAEQLLDIRRQIGDTIARLTPQAR
ncbi:MAG: DUF4091 domain-containing protein [Phycisphaeraceae bacterium]|nr:DUF4091 domain-containing protein [Phycisphaeraceae bacterium]